MSIVGSLFEKRKLDLTNAQAWADIGFLTPTAAGVPVSESSAMRYSAVYACVRILAETLAQLPLLVYERLERGKDRATAYPLFRLLHDAPNPLMTSFEWREALQGHLALWGNAYCEIEYNGAGRVTALWPLRPDKMVEVMRNGDDSLTYVYELPNSERIKLPGDRVFHVRGLSHDGITGFSPISLARQSIGLGLAAEEFGARFFGNDARPGGVLQHPGVLTQDAHQRLQGSWESRHGGLSRSHRVAILEQGMTYQQIGIPPEDAQFLETRKYQRSEIAGMYRIPLHMIGDLERATFSNIEHQSIEFVKFTMGPWLRRWESAINTRLMSQAESERYFAEFLVDGLLRGDTSSRYEAYAVGRQNGWLSANDIREMENLNPVEGGDVYLVPLNMVPADMVEELAKPEPEPEPTTDNGRQTTEEEQSRGKAPEVRYVTLRNGAEVRAEQWDAATARHRLQLAYLGLWEDAAGRLVRREANDVLNAAKRLMKNGEWKTFRSWLLEFYQEFAAVASKGYEPVMTAYAAQVAELAGKEMNSATPNLTGFAAAVLAEMGKRHAAMNQMSLGAILEEFQENSLPEIEARLEHNKEVQPGRIAAHESVRISNAIALAAYGALGASRKVWVTIGENCPYCDDLGGRTISIEGFFLGMGASLQPPGVEKPLVVNSNIGHAPAHEGCNCMVVAA